MRTTLDIPEELLVSVERSTGASTRREAVIIALEEYLRRRRRQQLIAAAGTLEFEVDPAEIRAQDRARLGS